MEMAHADEPIADHGVLSLPEEAWAQARMRSRIIAPLAAAQFIGHRAADEAARALVLSRRQIYALVHRYRQGAGLVTDMARRQSSGGRGVVRLSKTVEQIIAEILKKRYLTCQKLSLAIVHRDVARACKLQELAAPARNTVARRIADLGTMAVRRRREGPDAVRYLQSAGDVVPQALAPLEQVQIDHTVIDLIIVDEANRQPIGRPYLTVGIDDYSRCILGMVVTLEAPSAVSAGLCLAHGACDKRPWLEGLGAEVDWPMSGKPQRLLLDNAREFKSEALRRGCEQHGIEITYRPLGKPHYGGIVERLIGTAMQWIHELPGTTFSNPTERGDYDSMGKAILTLGELERWLVLAVAHYHGTVHGTLRQMPTARWAQGVPVGAPPAVAHPKAFLVDFLPVIRRKLTRTGFAIDHVHYFANALKPWIATRQQRSSFVIRRDPRNISRIWVLEPEENRYLEIPYRTLAYPAVTLWEHREAVRRLREQGRSQVDESALFQMIEKMRAITHTARRDTVRARRSTERRRHLKASVIRAALPEIPNGDDGGNAPPFDQIEDW